MRRRTPNYDEPEIEALLASYEELRAIGFNSRSGRQIARIATRLADLDKAMARLPLEYWEVVLLHGLVGIPQDDVARLLKTSRKAVAKRYRRGVEDIHYYINGGT